MIIYIAIWGFIMGGLSAYFWIKELLPFIRKIRSIKSPTKSHNPIKCICNGVEYIVELVKALTLLWAVILDIVSTFCVVGLLNISGFYGGIIGLTASNIISIYILQEMKKSKV